VDIENAIAAHPGVEEAAVVGVPHPKWEERPLALVVLKSEARAVSKQEIIDFIAPNFAKWQLPDEVKFVDEIPKTSVGKYNKKHIRVIFEDEFSANKH
jgi:fatty-acyl-CoA synthase